MDTTTTVTILRARQGEALKMLKRFAKKAKRYGVPFAYSLGIVRSEERAEPVDNPFYPGRVRKYVVEVVDVVLTGEKPVVGDYEFLASIEFAGDAGNFVDTVPGVELPVEYRTTDDRCEHCHTSRRRKHVFVARNRADGSLIQVGRTCLRDFLGTDDPKWIIQRFNFLRELEAWGEDEGWDGLGGAGFWTDELKRVLGIALASVRLWGWVSVGQSRADETLTPTVSRYWLHEMQKPSQHEAKLQAQLRAEVQQADFAVAEQIIEWVRGLEPDNDYLWNLQVAFQDDVLCDAKRLGLVVSAVSAWHRAQERELQRIQQRENDAVSRHQGVIGERLRNVRVRLEIRRGMGDNGWGWTELLKFRDEAGNLYTWFTGSAESWEIGQELVITGTVKAHKDFNGIEETQLTRVSVQQMEVAA